MDMSIRFPGINLVLDYVPRAFQIFGMEFTIYRDAYCGRCPFGNGTCGTGGRKES